MNADQAWLRAYNDVLDNGIAIAPRGRETRELPHHTHKIDMLYPVVTNPGRKLSYRFMAAEALWILKGQNTLADIVEYAPRMAEFSDDGVTLAGAYGPRIYAQFDYVANALRRDGDTRQAVLTLWQPTPLSSKDIPCTVAMDFKIRNGQLNAHVFMRSSDIWLGLPYDIFSFTCVAYTLIATLRDAYPHLVPGTLWITAASSHVYAENFNTTLTSVTRAIAPTPEELWSRSPFHVERAAILDYLADLRNTKKGDTLRWWEE